MMTEKKVKSQWGPQSIAPRKYSIHTADDMMFMDGEIAGPGAGKYLVPSLTGYNQHDPTKSRNPAFSLGPRLPPLWSKNDAPAPNMYDPTACIRSGPDTIIPVTMTGRAQFFMTQKETTPSAQDYNTSNCWDGKLPRAPKHSIGGVRNLMKCAKYSAGPGSYGNPSTLGKTDKGAVIKGIRNVSYETDTPSPLAYQNVNNPDPTKPRPPAFSLAKRVFPPTGNKKNKFAGPADYDRHRAQDFVLPKAPTATMGKRLRKYGLRPKNQWKISDSNDDIS